MSVPSTCLQQLPQVHQVVTGDQDAGAGLGAFGHLRRRGLAEGLDMTLVEHLHHAQVHLAALQAVPKQGLHVEVDVGHGREQGLFDEGRDLLVVLAETPGVGGIGGHALEAVEQGLLQRFDIFVLAADPGLLTQAVSRKVCSHWLQCMLFSIDVEQNRGWDELGLGTRAGRWAAPKRCRGAVSWPSDGLALTSVKRPIGQLIHLNRPVAIAHDRPPPILAFAPRP